MASELIHDSFTERQLVTFLLGEDEFGADIMDVKEIIRVPDITKVPNAPAYVEGACNLRGNVLPLIDGRTRFNLDKKEKDENNRVLVIDVEGKATGLIVDKVSEVMRVKNLDIEETPHIVKNMDFDYLNGVVKMNHGNRLIMLLDVVKAMKFNKDDEHGKHDQETSILTMEEFASYGETIEEEQLVSFLIEDEEYAIGIMQVKEIIRIPQMIKVPNSEDYLDGVVSIRNNLLPMINLRKYYGMEPLEPNEQMRILVVDMGTFTAGIIVDRISEVLRIPTNIIQQPPKFSSKDGDQMRGIAKLDNGKRMILILDPSKLISADDVEAYNHMNDENTSVSENHEIEKQILDEIKVVTFRLGVEEYGIKISNVQEINRVTEITKIPRSPLHIDGIVNLRGNVIPALNLRTLFKLEEQNVTDSTRIIFVDIEEKKIGIIVDSVSEVLTMDKKRIEQTPEILSSGIESDYVEGVGKLNEGKRMIMILNLEKIVTFG